MSKRVYEPCLEQRVCADCGRPATTVSYRIRSDFSRWAVRYTCALHTDQEAARSRIPSTPCPVVIEGAPSQIAKTIAAYFSGTSGQIALTLVPMAPHYGHHKQRLPASAYLKGIVAGLSSEPTEVPECPYDARRLPNFARGDNDPREAWRDGRRDGQRIREIVLYPERTPIPGLQYREWETLPRELQKRHDAARPWQEDDVDPCPNGDPDCETGDDGSCHDACEAR